MPSFPAGHSLVEQCTHDFRQHISLSKHVEIAEAFTHEQLQTRDDIIAVLLVGSAASGETSEYSDVDLRLIVEGREETKLRREGIDRWMNGIYVDATLATADDYLSVERILSDRGSADTINFGRILYDSTGRFADLQVAVRSQFMRPEWVRIRVEPAIHLVADRLPALRQAVDDRDPLYIHIHAGRVFAGLGFLPLLQQNVAVSSSRSMAQLVERKPAYALRLLEVEGATTMDADAVLSALEVFAALSAIDPNFEYATLAGYMVGKAQWMARNGYHREAVHTGWLHSGNRAGGCEFSGDAAVIAQARTLSAQWLSAVGWVGDDVLREKLTALNAIWSDLDSTAGAATTAARQRQTRSNSARHDIEFLSKPSY